MITGQVCVQGGNEFTDSCRDMDLAWKAHVDDGPVLVLPLASGGGAEYRIAGNNGRDYLRSLGFDDVSVAVEPGVQLDRVVHSIVTARTVVLPGGSPVRIRDRLVRTAVGGALRAHLAGGGALIGASAGAMVLAGRMVLPGVDDALHRGLGILPDVVILPHFVHDPDADARHEMVERVRTRLPDEVAVLGLPECSGVLYDDDAEPVALGVADSWRFTADGPTRMPRA